MGLFDRFKSKKEKIGRDKKPKHVVTDKAKRDRAAEQRRQFAAVPAAGVATKVETQRETTHQPSRKSAPRRDDTGQAYRILLRTVVTEKATRVQADGQYVFAVAPTANKLDVSRAIQSLYGVRPVRVNIMNMRGKFIRYGRTTGRTKAWKKAVITVPPGQKLDISGA
ncbi:MAG: 50S ribosomal protein L23 [Candidatus Kerfeldbacteria bacterium]|nr:50S ribosomal protein L23 [Candidatus Kerfeldbacteria bacterium]